jgi:excisionase family DNA binding protein
MNFPDKTSLPEPFVDANRAAEFLAISRKKLLEMARQRIIPCHPIGFGERKRWRFRLTELSRWMEGEVVKLDSHRGRKERKFS